MMITFSTKLTKFTDKDKITYQTAVLDFLTKHMVNTDKWKYYVKMNDWKIHLSHVSESDEEAFSSLTGDKLNFNIPHGITNNVDKTVTCYISDGSGDMFIRQNFVTISHELCHMILFIYYENARMVLRLPDKNMKAGSSVALATGEVHNRKSEGRLWTFRIGGRKVLHWYISGIPVQVIDIRDLCHAP